MSSTHCTNLVRQPLRNDLASSLTSILTPATTMTRTKLIQTSALLLGAALNHTLAMAHDGHGMPGFSHWHSTDLFGFVAVAVLVGAAMWLRGRK